MLMITLYEEQKKKDTDLRVFSNESVLHIRWPKYWSFSFSISPSNEHPGLISFRIDWFDLLAVQGTLKSLLQHHSSKPSILQCSVQLSHPYMTTRKTIALTRWTFVGKVMSLLFNMLCRLVIAFFPRSEHLLISWLQLPSAVILELKKIKSVTVSIVSPSICHEVMGPGRNHKTNWNKTQHNSWVCRIWKEKILEDGFKYLPVNSLHVWSLLCSLIYFYSFSSFVSREE